MVFSDFNHYLQGLINQLYSEPHASLMNGLLLGVKNLPKELEEAFKITGTIHVVVVSGYNISLVGGFFLRLSGLLKRQQAILLTLTAIVLYTLLVGPNPPVVRSALMASVSYLGVWLGRQRLALFSLLMAAGLMVALNPAIISSISFQLSFLATLGILVFADKFNLYLKNIPQPFKESLTVTLAAQIMVLPVIFYNFGTISLISPLVNTLVLWTIPLATVLGFISLLLGLIFFPLGVLFAWIAWAPMSIFIFIVNLGADIPLAQLNLGRNDWLMVIGWYLLVVSLFIYFKSKAGEVSVEEV